MRAREVLPLAFALAACARGARPLPPEPSVVTRASDVIVEVKDSELPHGLRPTLDPGVPAYGAPTTREAGVIGVRDDGEIANVVATRARPPVLEGSLVDPPDIEHTACVSQLAAGSFPAYRTYLRETFTQVRVERLEAGPKLVETAGWVDASAAFRGARRAELPLKKLAELLGVEVFGFVDDHDPRTAVLLVRRPPLRTGHLQYASFLDADGESADCGFGRVELMIHREIGDTKKLVVGVETAHGVRAVRLDANVLWLRGEVDARIGIRLSAAGPEADAAPLQKLIDFAEERGFR